jgi:hypothetical protein
LDICYSMILYVFLLGKSQKTTSSLPAMPQGSMFDKNDARVEQERAEAEEKRQRRRRCHSLHWPTRGLDQHLDQQTKSGPQNWVSWVSVRKSTLSCVSSTYYPRMAMESPQVSEWCWWNSGCQDHQKLREDLRDHGQQPRRMVFDCGDKISSLLYQDNIYICVVQNMIILVQINKCNITSVPHLMVIYKCDRCDWLCDSCLVLY